MITFLDSSIIVAGLVENQASHQECKALLSGAGQLAVFTHVFTEVFNTLTGSRLGFRIPAPVVATLLRERVLPRVQVVELNVDEILGALDQAEMRGVRGGAVFDYLHLAAGHKVQAARMCTLDVDDFKHFHRVGDPEIVHP